MKNTLLFLFLVSHQIAWAQISTRQISLNDAMVSSAILYNKYDNLVVLDGWEPGMDVSFTKCTVQKLGGDTFNVKANFTGSDVLVVKKGSQVIYEKPYKVLSYATASVNTSMLPGNEATAAQILESLTPVHKSALNNKARIVFLPKVGDALVFEIANAGKQNVDIKTACARMQRGDKVIIEFPGYAPGAKVVTLK